MTEILQTLEPITAVILVGMVAGVIEIIKRAFEKDWKAVATIIGAGVAGGVTIFILGGNPLTGITVGLATSGYVTIAQNFGKSV